MFQKMSFRTELTLFSSIIFPQLNSNCQIKKKLIIETELQLNMKFSFLNVRNQQQITGKWQPFFVLFLNVLMAMPMANVSNNLKVQMVEICQIKNIIQFNFFSCNFSKINL